MFAGLISKEQPVSAWGDPDKIMVALAPYSLDKPRDYWSKERQMLLQVATRNDAVTSEIYRHPESGVAVAFWGRLDNRSDLIQQLEAQHKVSDDALVALAWLKWGEHCPEKLIGDFAFAVSSPKTGVVFLVRDVMGVKPLYYRADEHGVFFANTAAAFKPLKLGTLTRSQKWMAEYMLELSHSHTETAYLEINKIPGAHCLLIHVDGRMNFRRYHQFVNDAPVENKRHPKYLEAYRAAWQEAVTCRMPTSGNIGTENSGGLDSGSITAEIARQLGLKIDRLYGMGFCRQHSEPEFIMATAMKYNMKHNYLVSNDSVNLWPEVRMREHCIHGYPQEHPDGSFHVPFFEICQQQGINVLHSGFGGDEAVTYYGGMAARLEMIDQGNLYGLWRILPGGVPMRTMRFVKSILNIKMPSRTLAILKQRWKYHLLRDYIIQYYGLEDAFLTNAICNDGFRTVNGAVIDLVSRSYVSSRFEASTLIAANYGVDYVWPFWDQRLIQQWLSSPLIWKVGDGGIGRYLHRMAIADVSAEIVAWKPTKDMGYSILQKVAENASNAPLLNQLLDLLGSLPSDLVPLIDVNKGQAMAERGLKEDWRGSNLHFAIEDYVYKLANLVAWLKDNQ